MISKVKYFDHNVEGNDYIVGDLHGCYNELFRMLQLIKFDFTKDRLFSVGDLIDRGKDSMKCLELINEPWFHCVLGNHEEFLISSFLHNFGTPSYTWVANGGDWTDKADLFVLSEYAFKLKELPSVIVIGSNTPRRVNIVHAELYKNADGGLVKDVDIDMWNFDSWSEPNMQWGRHFADHKVLFEDRLHTGLSRTYAGHTVVYKPKFVMNHVFIDLGAVFAGGKLCMVQIDKKSDNDTFYVYNVGNDKLEWDIELDV